MLCSVEEAADLLAQGPIITEKVPPELLQNIEQIRRQLIHVLTELELLGNNRPCELRKERRVLLRRAARLKARDYHLRTLCAMSGWAI